MRTSSDAEVVMYKPGGSIDHTLTEIGKNNYVLPAIQREFVWRPEQIERLFDSLMQGYPIGTFLFWKVEPENAQTFKFYDFVRHYHERNSAHCPELDQIGDRPLIAVLDGQQRLTALNIGLRGSMAWRSKGQRRNNPLAYPKRTLHLDLINTTPKDESGIHYRFKFLEPEKATEDPDAIWFEVPHILSMNEGVARLSAIQDMGLEGEQLNHAFNMLERLRQMVATEPLVNYYEETSQDLERVLNIFIRLNSGGTVLSHSDLLLSIAVAQWQQIDARSEIHGLVDELNDIGDGFSFDHDFVLKAGLMLAGAPVGFKVANFTAANMSKLERQWKRVRETLIRTIQLIADFGLSSMNLRAESSILPIAYYLHHRELPESYSTSGAFSEDRAAIRFWLMRSLLKPSGIWGSGLDTLLTALREELEKHGKKRFPAEQLARRMARSGKSLTFDEDEVEELLEMQYNDNRTLLLLSLLFPFIDMRNKIHVDHVFPISRFTKSRLKRLGYDEEEAVELRWYANSIVNLQLLEGQLNNEKRARLPAEWLHDRFQKKRSRNDYCEKHLLGDVPANLNGFRDFADARWEAFQESLVGILSVEKIMSE